MKPRHLFSPLNTEELINLSPLLLQKVLDTIPTGIQILKAMRDEKNEVVDFEFILVNNVAKNYTSAEKIFIAESLKNNDNFRDLVDGVNHEPGNKSTPSFSLNSSANWFHIKYVKFGDGVLLSIEDVTDKKMLEAGGQNNQHLMQQIAETSPDIIYILDLQTGLVTYTNRMMATELGYTMQQIAEMKNPLLDIFYEEDITSMREHLKKVKKLPDNTVLEIEHRMKNKNGELSWYCTRTSVFKRNKSGIPVEKLGISHNITARKLQEEKIFTDLEILKQAEQIIEMGTWIYDVRNDQFSWSEGMYRLFNLPEQIRVKPEIYLDFVPENEKSITGELVQKIKAAEPIDTRIHLVVSEKETKTVRIKAIAVKDSDGKTIKSVGVDRDITEQVKMEQKIDRLNENIVAANHDLAKVNLEMQTFSSIAANDYKETLKHLYTNLEYITSLEAQNLSNTGRANIRRAQAAIQKLKLLTEDIIIYSSIQNLDGEKRPVDMNELLDNVKLYTFKKIKDEDIDIKCSNTPALQGYPALLSLLFHHLLENAIKFNQQGKKTIIHIDCTQQEAVVIENPAAVPGKKYAVISITDNGHGFAPGHAEEIFKMFFRVPGTNNHRGSGMGLAICKKIMDIHGGFITAESIPGNGASFYCYFPI